MKDTPPLLVMGAGAWGTALAIHLAGKGLQVALWGRDPLAQKVLQLARQNQKYLPGVFFPETLSVCMDLSSQSWDKVIVAVPSDAFSDTLALLKSFLAPTAQVLCATKGFCHGQWLADVAQVQLGSIPFGFLSGPSFAKEVARGAFTAIVLATAFPKLAATWQPLLHTPYFRVYVSTDVMGVSLAGVVKNILALAVGIAEGLGLGANAKSALITRGLAEMTRLGQQCGAVRETLMGLSGLGDLVLTATDNQSRNRRCGVLLGEGLVLSEALARIGQVVESVSNSSALVAMAQRLGVELPICEAVDAVLTRKITVQEALLRLMLRPSAIQE